MDLQINQLNGLIEQKTVTSVYVFINVDLSYRSDSQSIDDENNLE